MPDHFYVYPAYVSRSTTRAEGRRIPGDACVTGEVTPEMLASAARSLGYQVEVEPKQYPRLAGTLEGRLKVTKREGVTKTAFLRELAGALAKLTPPSEKE